MVSIKGSVGIGDLLKSIALGWLKNSLQTGSRGKDSLKRVLGGLDIIILYLVIGNPE